MMARARGGEFKRDATVPDEIELVGRFAFVEEVLAASNARFSHSRRRD